LALAHGVRHVGFGAFFKAIRYILIGIRSAGAVLCFSGAVCSQAKYSTIAAVSFAHGVRNFVM
jgi:hypothetical protein